KVMVKRNNFFFQKPSGRGRELYWLAIVLIQVYCLAVADIWQNFDFETRPLSPPSVPFGFLPGKPSSLIATVPRFTPRATALSPLANCFQAWWAITSVWTISAPRRRKKRSRDSRYTARRRV